MRNQAFAIGLWLMASIASAGELLVFSTEHCHPCVAFKNDLEATPEMAEGHRVTFAGKDSELWKKLGITSTPTFMLFNDKGNFLKRKEGYRNRREFGRWLRD